MENGKKENGEETIDVETQCIAKGKLMDSISASAKLTKADAGRALDVAIESSIKLRNFKVMEPEP